jgi:hypothetical protein
MARAAPSARVRGWWRDTDCVSSRRATLRFFAVFMALLGDTEGN